MNDQPAPKKRGGNVRNARTTHPRRQARRDRAAARAPFVDARTEAQTVVYPNWHDREDARAANRVARASRRANRA